MGTLYLRLSLFIFIVILCNNCKKSAPPPALKADHEIQSFSLRADSNRGKLAYDVFGTIRNDSILLKVPVGTQVSSLSPSITFNGKSISPATGVAQNFTNPIAYTVTAENGSSRVYTAAVSFLDSNKQIISFVFKKSDNPTLTEDITLSPISDTMSAAVPPETDLSKLVPTIVYKGKSISPMDKIATNFSGPVVYTVTAEDGSYKQYTVMSSKNAFVYVGCSNGFIYALYASTGKIKWQYNCGSAVGNPAYDNGSLYFPLANGNFLSLDAATGVKKWQTSIGAGSFTNVAAQDGLLAFSVARNLYYYTYTLYTLDQTTGNIIWQKPGVGYGDPTISNGMIVVSQPFTAGVSGIRISDSQQVWNVGGSSIVTCNPLVTNNIVYYGGEEANAVACDLPTGTVKWKTVLGGNSSHPTSGQGLIFSSFSTYLFAINMADGKNVWTINPYAAFGSVSYTNSIVIAEAGGYIRGYDAATGNLVWQNRFSSNYNTTRNTSIAAANGSAYYGLSDGTLQATDAATGRLIWNFQQHNTLFTHPCVVDTKGNRFHVPDSGNQQ
ncbi:MAG: PQQ-binding-like beta-propeller repeat protein [Chitinophagaceae bacterium]